MRRKKQHKEDGKVWTSYSDMFTTMAIVFLVMFVFAMIKVGVSTMEKIAQDKVHQKELEGLVPKEVQKRNQKH